MYCVFPIPNFPFIQFRATAVPENACWPVLYRTTTHDIQPSYAVRSRFQTVNGYSLVYITRARGIRLRRFESRVDYKLRGPTRAGKKTEGDDQR